MISGASGARRPPGRGIGYLSSRRSARIIPRRLPARDNKQEPPPDATQPGRSFRFDHRGTTAPITYSDCRSRRHWHRRREEHDLLPVGPRASASVWILSLPAVWSKSLPRLQSAERERAEGTQSRSVCSKRRRSQGESVPQRAGPCGRNNRSAASSGSATRPRLPSPRAADACRISLANSRSAVRE